MAKNSEKTFSPKEAAVISEAVRQSQKINEEKIKNLNWLMGAIVVVLFVAVITMLIMVAQIVIEAFRFNSTVCQESQQQKIIIDELQNIRENLDEIKSKK